MHLEDVEKENVVLRKENTILRKKLTKYENAKKNSISSVPPSKNENRRLKTKSLREQTGGQISGQKCWAWTWQNEKKTYVIPSGNRGFATIQSNFEDAFPKSVLVHDCWKSHFQTPVENHQICTAHLLRELNYFIEVHKDPWSIKLHQLILEYLRIKKENEARGLLQKSSSEN